MFLHRKETIKKIVALSKLSDHKIQLLRDGQVDTNTGKSNTHSTKKHPYSVREARTVRDEFRILRDCVLWPTAKVRQIYSDVAELTSNYRHQTNVTAFMQYLSYYEMLL